MGVLKSLRPVVHRQVQRRTEPLAFSIVIPAYNEQRRLPATLRRIEEFLSDRGYRGEIIVVDDGSKDDTLSALKAMARECSSLRVLSHDRNRGKGFAVRTGILAASHEMVLFSDADLSTPIEEVERLFPYLKSGYDIAIASRYVGHDDGRVVQSSFRRLVGRIFAAIVSLIGVRGFGDTQCGFKLFRARAAQHLFSHLRTSGFSFDVEILLRAKSRGYRIREVPVRWVADSDSRVRPFRDSLPMLLELLRIRGVL